MGKVETNNEIRIEEIKRDISKHNNVIPHCSTRKEAEGVQDDILVLEEEMAELEQIESEACPECGSYEQDSQDDDLACKHEYHEG